MNMFKSNGGFTLVELIVVIAILAILAGVAIPAYSGYITKAQDAAVVTELDAIATAAQAANAQAGEITGITVKNDGKTITVSFKNDKMAENFESDFNIFYAVGNGGNATDGVVVKADVINNWANSSYKNGAVWAAGKWTPVE